MKRLNGLAVIVLLSCFLVPHTAARTDTAGKARSRYVKRELPPSQVTTPDFPDLFATAVAETFVLAEFDFGGLSAGPDPQGWYGVDLTAQSATFFHVDDFAGLGGGNTGRLVPINDQQSLWCGQRPAPDDPRFCNYAVLPGYGNGWDQNLYSADFACGADVRLTFKASYDSEPFYDYTYVFYLSKTGTWNELMAIDDAGETTAVLTVPYDSLDGSVRFKFQFKSDGAFSDEDGFWPTDGAIILDSLVVSDAGGVIDFQDFESETPGDTVTADGDWWAEPSAGYGDFSGVFSGMMVLQEDPCERNITGLWGFFQGSTYTMSCAGHPEQAAIPYGELRDGEMFYLNNEIWSPLIDWNTDMYGNPVPGTASEAYFQFDMYVDNPLDPLIFPIWHMRSYVDGCPKSWQDRAFVSEYFGTHWMRISEQYADLVYPGADQIQLALAAIDMCKSWCGFYGSGECHHHAPLYDNVRIIRVNHTGPQWYIRDIEMFQDNFASDGTVTGTVRIDIPYDHAFSSSPFIHPGDSLVVNVSEPNVGLGYHTPGVPSSGPAVYIHVKDIGTKAGATISGDLSRWPVAGTGGGWTILRMDTSFVLPGYPQEGKFCVDLNDALYTPGDTLLYYMSARDANGVTTYCYKRPANSWEWEHGVTDTEAEARARPFEMTCLPANALSGATDILYIDDFHRRGAGIYFESAFDVLGVTPDRYDVLGSSSNMGNGPGARVASVYSQIIPYYKKIIWNSGNLSLGTIGDGTGEPEKSNDFLLLHTFLNESLDDPGVYISGDRIAQEWINLTGASAIATRAGYMNFDLVSYSHRDAGEPVSPLVIGAAGTLFEHAAVPDTALAVGGCPVINDFCVLEPLGTARLGMSYSGNRDHGAVITQTTTNNAFATARVVLSGFSFHYMNDDRTVLPHDEVHHLLDILRWFGNEIPDPTGGDQPPGFENSMSQNYPNPFNPETAIRFSIRDRGRVTLKIYNVAGQLVRTLVDEVREPNVYSQAWDGLDGAGQPVASGVYFCRLTAKNFEMTRKMVLLK